MNTLKLKCLLEKDNIKKITVDNGITTWFTNREHLSKDMQILILSSNIIPFFVFLKMLASLHSP